MNQLDMNQLEGMDRDKRVMLDEPAENFQFQLYLMSQENLRKQQTNVLKRLGVRLNKIISDILRLK